MPDMPSKVTVIASKGQSQQPEEVHLPAKSTIWDVSYARKEDAPVPLVRRHASRGVAVAAGTSCEQKAQDGVWNSVTKTPTGADWSPRQAGLDPCLQRKRYMQSTPVNYPCPVYPFTCISVYPIYLHKPVYLYTCTPVYAGIPVYPHTYIPVTVVTA